VGFLPLHGERLGCRRKPSDTADHLISVRPRPFELEAGKCKNLFGKSAFFLEVNALELYPLGQDSIVDDDADPGTISNIAQ
jgi:hypothetical protein